MPKTIRNDLASAQWLSLQDAAAMYGVCVKTLRRAIDRGDLQAGRVGPKVIRVRLVDLERLFRPIPSAKSVLRSFSP